MGSASAATSAAHPAKVSSTSRSVARAVTMTGVRSAPATATSASTTRSRSARSASTASDGSSREVAGPASGGRRSITASTTSRTPSASMRSGRPPMSSRSDRKWSSMSWRTRATERRHIAESFSPRAPPRSCGVIRASSSAVQSAVESGLRISWATKPRCPPRESPLRTGGSRPGPWFTPRASCGSMMLEAFTVTSRSRWPAERPYARGFCPISSEEREELQAKNPIGRPFPRNPVKPIGPDVEPTPLPSRQAHEFPELLGCAPFGTPVALRSTRLYTGPPGGMMKSATTRPTASSLEVYLSEINRFPLLTVEEEQRLGRDFAAGRDTRAAHRLVTANLRFVVKVAYEYRSYGFRMADLIQEGNSGLMKAVQKFDADKGIRLISYAVWWIRAYIQNYILKSWSLVKLGTTQAQRKLFFSLARTRRELDKSSVEHGADSDGRDSAKVAKKLRVKPGEVREMEQRMEGRDLSLDAPLGEDGTYSHVDFVVGDGAPQDDELSTVQEQQIVSGRVVEALGRLDQRERYIIEQRVMSDRPLTLKELGEHFGFSRERARQLEIRAKEKLKTELHALAVDLDWPTDGSPVDLDDAAAA